MIIANEKERVKALYSYQMMDTDAEKHYDSITYLASYICKTSMSAINLIDENRAWIKSKFGYTGSETPKDLSFCKYTISTEDVLEIPDTMLDDRVKNNPFVDCQNGVRYYAGAPLINPEGYVLGSICVLDNKPNQLDEEQKKALKLLADEVVLHLEAAKKTLRLRFLLKEQQEFQALFNNSSELHFILNKNGKIKFVNRSVEQLLGYLPEEVIGRSIWDFCNQDDRKIILQTLKESFGRGEKQIVLRTSMRSKSGESRWFSWSNVNIDGQWLINGRDITAQIIATQELEQLSLVASHVNSGVVINDANNKILWVNKAFETITGYSLADVKEKKLRDVITSKETDEHDLAYAGIQSSNKNSFSIEILTSNKDREPIWLSVMNSVILDEKGEISKSIEIITDITERKKTELELQTLSAAVTQSEVGVLIRNEKDEVIWLNESLERLLGWKLEELEGSVLGMKFLVGELTDLDEVLKAKKEFANCKPYDIEALLYKKDGTPIWISVHSSPLFNKSGVLERQLGLFMDITVRKKAEQELIRTREKALQLSHAKETFISVMSHEIRTPINVVIGMSRLLLEEDPAEHQLEHINILKFSSENLLALVNDILDFTKIETGNMALESFPVNLKELARRTLNTLEFKLEDKNLKLKLSVDTKIPEHVLADSTRLYQIMINLLGNAVKFTREGEVKLTLTLEKEDRETITVKFIVSDTGIGIHQDKLDSIFEAYTQASSDTTRKYGGTGLGLTITKKLIELHQSDIKVKSNFGHGSEFSFAIQFKRSVRDVPLILSNLEHENWKALVLVADDNAINCKLAKKVLSKWGIQTDIAENGQQAYEMVTQKNYDLVLMDLHMPVLDGLKATKKIRVLQDEKYQTLPIIALTGSVFGMDLENLQEEGLTDYFLKPYTPDGLFQKIKPYLKNLKINEQTKITG